MQLMAATLIVLPLVAIACSSDDPKPQPEVPEQPEEPSEPENPAEPVDATTAYFQSVLAGEEAEMPADAEIEPTADALKAMRDEIWGAWKRANELTDTEKLPNLMDIGNADYTVISPNGQWKMGNTSSYFVYGSKGTKPADGYPLFIHLHGSGDDADADWRATLGWGIWYDDGPSAYLTPRSPAGGTGCRWFTPTRQDFFERVLRRAMLSDDINPDAIFFTGISEGAYGSQRLAAFYADYLAGAGPMAGGDMISNCPPENMANIAFALHTGDSDYGYGRNELSKRFKTMLDDLEKQYPGYYNHHVMVPAGLGHGDLDRLATSPWLKSARRNAVPAFFRWEVFKMGGELGEDYRGRTIFYCLREDKQPQGAIDATTRASYEFHVADNTIDITASAVRITATDANNEWNIPYGVEKSYTAATGGELTVFVDETMVDISKDVTVNVNGTERFSGKLTPMRNTAVESCALLGDPRRIFPAKIKITY